jgi:hypothetical protein
MPVPSPTPDAPHCLNCEYTLSGLANASHCPECGVALPVDRSLLYGPRAFGLDRLRLSGLLRASWFALRHPVRACRAADSERCVGKMPALAFAAFWTALTIYLYPTARLLGMTLAFGIKEGPAVGLRINARYWLPALNPIYQHFPWEAWAITRWWVFFVPLALGAAMLDRERDHAAGRAMRRLLVFTPWFALLEAGFLAASYLTEYNVVPEPSTLFGSYLGWAALLHPPWPLRMIPTFLITLLFARAVMKWRWTPAIAVAAIATPIAIRISVLWCWLYIWARN